ncbi:DNA ligase [Mesorhizobium sp. M2A.F.Ca.ET.039.01.1.1]|nr:DNA ligase [Mesorhizobium sp. M2A.F.Ca.ET.039.01.1.1]
MSPVLIEVPPAGDDWLHEIKHDGYRTELILDWAGARAFSKKGFDWSSKYWPIVTAAEALPASSFILDGEMIAPDATGHSDLQSLRQAMKWNAERLAFVAFDILHLDGKDLRALPLIERKAILWDLVKPAQGAIQFVQHVVGGGAEFFQAAEQFDLEGIVSKRPNSAYRSGASDAWVKTKCFELRDLEIVGLKRAQDGRPVALLADGGKYVGSAAVAVSGEMRKRLWARMKEGGGPPPRPLVGRVRTLKGEGLRHASLKEFHERDDAG